MRGEPGAWLGDMRSTRKSGVTLGRLTNHPSLLRLRGFLGHGVFQGKTRAGRFQANWDSWSRYS